MPARMRRGFWRAGRRGGPRARITVFAIEVDGALVGGRRPPRARGHARARLVARQGSLGQGLCDGSRDARGRVRRGRAGVERHRGRYFEDNPASGRVLRKTRFRGSGVEARYSLAVKRMSRAGCWSCARRESRVLLKRRKGEGPAMAVEIRPYPDPGSGSLATKRLVLRPFRLSDGRWSRPSRAISMSRAC